MIGFPVDYRRDQPEFVAKKLTAILQGLVALNLVEMERQRFAPLLDSGIVYRREPRWSEMWRSASIVYAQGFGDCEDLSAILAAQWIREGLPAQAIVREARGVPGFHAVVMLRGVEYDPSAILIRKERRRS
ncbi:MAG: hypothetical protein QM519_02325 [Bacteroidia bacterium]|jgi:hypothetical protein|nr:hypothetical protein [Bacteroidia bacterium]